MPRARLEARLRALAALALGLSLTACLASGPVGGGRGSGGGAERSLGTFSSATGGDPAGAWKVEAGAPDLCRSGEHQIFFGADFVDRRQGAVLRLIVDPANGAAVRVFDLKDPERRTLVVRPAECRLFRYRLEPSGWRINDYRDFEVELEVDCTTSAGAQVKASVSARHCS